MKKGIFLFFFTTLVIFLVGCDINQSGLQKESSLANEETSRSATIFAMDTIMDIMIYGGDDGLLKQVEERIQNLDKKLSTTDKNSDVYTLNQKGEAIVSKDTEVLLDKALALCNKTQGVLDISIYPIVRIWGFTTGEYSIPDKEKIQSLLTKVDYRNISQEGPKVRIEKGMEIDLGSVAKGYASDEIVSLLKKSGVTSALLNLGGNVHALGTKQYGSDWNIAIQDPLGNGPLGVVSVSDEAVVTSGGYERYFEDDNGNLYWHIMDPETGYPADSNLISVTIISPSGVYSDALSTAMFIKGLDKGIEFWQNNRDFEVIFIDKSGQVYITSGLENRFSFTESFKNQTFMVIQDE